MLRGYVTDGLSQPFSDEWNQGSDGLNCRLNHKRFNGRAEAKSTPELWRFITNATLNIRPFRADEILKIFMGCKAE